MHGSRSAYYVLGEGILPEPDFLSGVVAPAPAPAAVLGSPPLKGKTPLWYYILKEAELRGDSKLGRVGGRIVAETLVGLIKNSRHSILKAPGWYPRYPERADSGTASAKFGMTDLLEFLGPADINPYP